MTTTPDAYVRVTASVRAMTEAFTRMGETIQRAFAPLIALARKLEPEHPRAVRIRRRARRRQLQQMLRQQRRAR